VAEETTIAARAAITLRLFMFNHSFKVVIKI
jgi:hypothetical protein